VGEAVPYLKPHGRCDRLEWLNATLIRMRLKDDGSFPYKIYVVNETIIRILLKTEESNIFS
jgi:hypothetical protein